MLFDFKIVLELHRTGSISRPDLAGLLGVSYNHLYRVEKGLRQPSLGLVKKMSEVTGVPVASLISGHSEPDGEREPEIGGGVLALIDLKGKLDRNRDKLIIAEEYNAELERKTEHLMALIRLHTRFEDIICDDSLSKAGRMEKLRELAKAAAQENEAGFNEIRSILRVKRAVVRGWLRSDRQVYSCAFAEGGEISAANPGEAALRLKCFDCGAFESSECRGHGNEKRPANIIELFGRLEANGVISHAEQAGIITGCYKTPIDAHGISEVKYRYEHGLSIPDGVFYLDGQPRKK